MSDEKQVLDTVRQAVRSVPRLGPIFDVHVAFSNGAVTIEAEAPDIAAKKLGLEAVAAVPEVKGIVDRLRVKPAQRMGDREILAHLRGSLVDEPALLDCGIFIHDAGKTEKVRLPEDAVGNIHMECADGVVVLNGELPGLAHKRLAGVLAWWVPGSRDVVNGITVNPPEEDSDDAIADTVRIVLEKDPVLDAGQVRVGVSGAEVRLTGIVSSPMERDLAEFDAWYVLGVDRVDNRIETRP